MAENSGLAQTTITNQQQTSSTTQAEAVNAKQHPLPDVYVVGLSVLATVGLVAMWWVFWSAVARTKENVHDLLVSSSFFRVVTVMGVIAATVVLSLAGRMEGNITGAILSGIVGYVLGQISSPNHGANPEKKQGLQPSPP